MRGDVGGDNTAGRLPMNWEMNERISLSSGSSTGLAVRPDTRRGIEFSENRKKTIESRSRIGACSERNRGAKFSSGSSAKPALQLMNVSGFPSSIDRKHRGSSRSTEVNMADENVLRSDSKYEIGIPSRSFATVRDQRRQDTLGKVNADAMRSRTKNKCGDSISKRLELIHELNQKILANYERFQLRSKRAKDAKEETVKDVKSRVKDGTDAEEHIYTEIKKRNRPSSRTSDRKAQKTPRQNISNQATLRENSSKQDTSRRTDITFSRNYSEKTNTKDRTEKKSLRVTNEPNRRIVCENTNFSMAVKNGFSSYQTGEGTQLPTYPNTGDTEGRLCEASSIFYTSENLSAREIESASTENRLENSRLYPESCNIGGNGEPKGDSTKENAKDNVSGADRSGPQKDAGSRDARSEGDANLDEKILESRILENLDETIDRFDSEKIQLSSGDSNGEKDSFSTDSIQSPSPSGAKGLKTDANLLDTFNSSWDSGVGVDVGNGSGWVRIHTGIESSLVYLTLDTTAKDVCRDMLLGDDLSLFVQVNDGRLGLIVPSACAPTSRAVCFTCTNREYEA